MIESASYLVCLGKREKKKIKKKKREKRKEKKEKEGEEKEKKCEKKKREEKNSDLSRINPVPEFGLESVLRTVQ